MHRVWELAQGQTTSVPAPVPVLVPVPVPAPMLHLQELLRVCVWQQGAQLLHRLLLQAQPVQRQPMRRQPTRRQLGMD